MIKLSAYPQTAVGYPVLYSGITLNIIMLICFPFQINKLNLIRFPVKLIDEWNKKFPEPYDLRLKDIIPFL
jgi:hypothetical protein